MAKRVTVFGSSLPCPGDEEYESAYRLGQILGENGINVCSGGYQGIMDAVSKGAVEKGSEALGITVDSFIAKVSDSLTEEIRCETLFERIEKLVEHGDAFVILRGGTGTLLEMAVIWEMINKKLISGRPIACHGMMWKGLIDLMDERMEYEGRPHGIIFHSESIEECAQHIIDSLKSRDAL